jgi:hypothetical protein
MPLPTTAVAPKRKDPGMLTLFGQSKVGKTTLLSQLPNCLIIDTEKGADYVSGLIAQANSYRDLIAIGKELKESVHKYDYVAIDTIDKVSDWMEAQTVFEYNQDAKLKVASFSDIPYGGGYNSVRNKMMGLLASFKAIAPKLILIGHRKKTVIGETEVKFSSASLDLTGKLKNMICADSDAIGYIYREEGVVMISFETTEELEAGSRCDHLKGKVFPFNWSQIYIDSK